MAKVVYNSCYGGFSLSRMAILRGRAISGDPKWGGVSIKGDVYNDGTVCDDDYGGAGNIERHDPILVQVVEELREEASGNFASLRIKEIPSGTLYRIDEYDGNERVMTNSDYDWTKAP